MHREHFGKALSHFLLRFLQVSQDHAANAGGWLDGLILATLSTLTGSIDTLQMGG